MKQKGIFSRFMATTTDLVITLIPILVWDIMVLIVLAGFLPSSVISFLNENIIYVIIASFCITNPIITLIYGKTLGQMVFDIRIKDLKGKPAKAVQLALREFLGGILILGCSYIFYGLGVVVYLILNLIVIIVDKCSRGIVDFICHTRPINVNEVEEVVVKKKEEPLVEKLEEVLPSKENENVFHYDLHVQSKHSIHGKDTVEELFQKAKKAGIDVISITDLFSVKANYEAEVLSEPYQIKYIPGIEIECIFEGYFITVLGYNIDYKDNRYMQLENEYIKLQRESSMQRIEKFKEVSGIDMNLSRLINQNTSGIVTGEMIVKEVLDNPLYETVEFLKKYQGKAYNQLYSDYFAMNKPCYVEKLAPKLEEVLELIRDTHGVSILAHPKRSCGEDTELIKRVMNQGFDGIEVFSPYHDEKDIQTYLSIVREMNCFVSCGSDYVGDASLMIQMGESHASAKYEKLLRIMIDRCLKKVEQRG